MRIADYDFDNLAVHLYQLNTTRYALKTAAATYDNHHHHHRRSHRKVPREWHCNSFQLFRYPKVNSYDKQRAIVSG